MSETSQTSAERLAAFFDLTNPTTVALYPERAAAYVKYWQTQAENEKTWSACLLKELGDWKAKLCEALHANPETTSFDAIVRALSAYVEDDLRKVSLKDVVWKAEEAANHAP